MCIHTYIHVCCVACAAGDHACVVEEKERQAYINFAGQTTWPVFCNYFVRPNMACFL